MKKILTLILALTMVLTAASCTQKDNNNDNGNGEISAESDISGDVQDDAADSQTRDEQVKNPVEEAPDNAESTDDNRLEAISYEGFKEVIGYSMAPYDTPVNAEKNMIHAVTGYNGEVELTYFDFVLSKNADSYFDEIKATFPGTVTETVEDGDYELCKLEDGEYYYMMARVGKTIVFGSCKSGYEPLNNWFYGLGYITK